MEDILTADLPEGLFCTRHPELHLTKFVTALGVRIITDPTLVVGKLRQQELG